MNIRFIAWGGIVDKKLQLMGDRGKQAGAQQCQDQQSLSQLPLAPSQLLTSWELVTYQLPTSWELAEALQDLKTTILRVWWFPTVVIIRLSQPPAGIGFVSVLIADYQDPEILIKDRYAQSSFLLGD